MRSHFRRINSTNMRTIFLLSALFITSLRLIAQMSGTYTVNPGGGGNYTTIAAAISALQTQGVSGPVTINIVSGVYPEALVIDPIAGASATNTITFRSATGSAAAVTIAPTTSVMNNGSAAIFVNGADHVHFERMTVDAFLNGIFFTGDVAGLAITGCVVQGDPLALTWGFGGYLNGVLTDFIIEECTFSACLTAISLLGSASVVHENIVIRRNTLTSSVDLARGLTISHVRDMSIEENVIDLQTPLPSQTVSVPAIRLLDCAGAVVVAKNHLVVNTGDGITLMDLDSPEETPCLVENNMVRLIHGPSVAKGLNFSDVDHLVCRQNTVRCDEGHAALKIQRTGVILTGNIFSSTTMEAVAWLEGPLNFIIDRNLWHAPGSTVVKHRPSMFTPYTSYTLPQWQAMGYDANSIFADPQFLSTTDLHIAPSSPAVGLAPFPATVATDIDGDPRPGVASNLVEAGADELDVCAPMSGTYTIGTGTTAHFPNLNAAKTALYQCGIGGPVTFSITPGTYTEYLSFDTEVPGASATNVIRWRGQTGNITSVVLRPPTGIIPLLSIAAVDHMIFENFTLSRTNNQATGLVRILNTGAPVCQGLVFRNMRFVGNAMTGASNYLVYGTAPDAPASTTFETCEFTNGSIAIKWNGAAGERLVISECVVTGWRQEGFQLSGMGTGLGVAGNTLISGVGSASAIGLSNCNGSFRVSDNTIDITGIGSGNPMGIGLGNCVCTASKRGSVVNNTIISWHRNRSIGIRMAGTTSYVDVWNNSISLQNSNHTGSPLEIASGFTGNNNRVNNNILGAQASYAVYNFTGADIGTLRNNVLYTTQADLAYWNGARADMPALQAVSSQFAASIEADPLFVSASTDLHIQPTSPAVAAAHLSTSPSRDFEAQLRPQPAGTNPDIGADEVDQSAPAAGGKRLDDADSTVRYFPNPVNDRLTITTDEARTTQYRVIDLQGRTALEGQLDLPGVLDLSSVAAGTYLLVTDVEEKAVRIVVQH